MSANSVWPPLSATLRPESRENFDGIARNELSECHSRLPRLNSRVRSSRASGLPSLPRLDTSAMSVLSRRSSSFIKLLPSDRSISPKLRLNATCCSSLRL